MHDRPVLLFVVAAMTLTVGCASDSEEVPEVDLTSSDHVLTDTDELRAGTFTAFADDANLTEDLIVGTHPDVDQGSIPVEVEPIDPTGAASTSYEYQASSTTVDGEGIQPTPTATFTVGG